ncbi:ABC transporter permease subunit [Escherichia coli]
MVSCWIWLVLCVGNPKLKRKEFIEGRRVGGVSTSGIVIRHIVPNVLGVVVVYASLLVPSMILFQSFLSFLGWVTQELLSNVHRQ